MTTRTDEELKTVLIDALKDVFGDSDTSDPEHMKVLVRRIPILCTNVEAMHQNIKAIQSNITWVGRLIIGAVILAVMAMVFKR